MSRSGKVGLDPRAWLAWGLAASLTPLLGRNPFPLLVVVLAVVTVRGVWIDHAARSGSWRGIVRLAFVFATISVLFNLLTVRAGDQPFARIPDVVPIINGPVTWNALVYGVLSAIAVVSLVMIGTTVGALVDWTAVTRLLPTRLATFAVAGSVAIAFIPRTIDAFREIKEAQAIRGHRFRGIRDLIPIFVPLLTGGLERAVTMAEALESRAFGSSMDVSGRSHRVGSASLALGLAAVALAGYLLAVSQARAAMVVGITGVAALLVGWRLTATRGPRRTRLRRSVWTAADWWTVLGAGLVIVGTLASLALDGRALRYDPYPDLTMPWVEPIAMVAQLPLLVPAIVLTYRTESRRR